MAAAAANLSEVMVNQVGKSDSEDMESTVALKAPVTSESFVYPHSLDDGICQPNTPRELEAVDGDHPHGHESNGYSVLQQHVLFFDLDSNGIIYPWETFQGFRAIGFNPIFSFIAMVFINAAFSYPTLESWIPSLLFPIYIKNIHKDKHGSDTEVYDTQGRFIPEKFEELFTRFAKSEDKTQLGFEELLALTNAYMNAYDLFGWTAAKLEWLALYLLIRDENGFVSKEHIRGMYDGTLFYTMAQVHHSKMRRSKQLKPLNCKIA